MRTYDVAGLPNPFRVHEQHRFRMPVGTTLDDCLVELVERSRVPPTLLRHCAIVIDREVFVPQRYWRHIRVQAGHEVHIRAVPQGGVIGLIGLAASFFVPAIGPTISIFGSQFALGTLVIKGAISVATTLLEGAFASTPDQVLSPNPASSRPNPAAYSITGVRNDARPYGLVPRIYGKVERYHPPLAAGPYTDIWVERQRLYMLFCVGWGHDRVKISDRRVGDTPERLFRNFNFREDEGIGASAVGLFPTQVRETTLNIELRSNVWHQRQTPENTARTTVDIGFPNGLYRTSQHAGTKATVRVIFHLQWRTIGGSWKNADEDGAELRNESGMRTDASGPGRFSTGDHRARTLRRAMSVVFPTPGQYEVRLRRVSKDDQGPSFGDGWLTREHSVWLSVKHVEEDRPVAARDVALMSVRAVATDQLNGVIDSWNITVEQYLPRWNGASWISTKTRSPAWAFVDVLSGPLNKRPIDRDTRIDREAMRDWASYCDDEGLTFDGVLATPTTVRSFLQQVASVGRASPDVVDGKYTVVIDRPKTFVVDHISPRNSRSFEAVKRFGDEIHAIKLRYPSVTVRHQTVERYVYNDGYSESNATLFETMDLPWVVEDDAAYKWARYALAVQKLRPETYSVEMDAEHIQFTRGDLVRLSYDVFLVGGTPPGAIIRAVTMKLCKSTGTRSGVLCARVCRVRSIEFIL